MTVPRHKVNLVTEIIEKEREVIVLTRVSEVKTVLTKEVSMYSMEENALCRALSPEWNRGGFPEIHDNDTSPYKELYDFLNEDLIQRIKGDQMEDVQDEVMTYLDSISVESVRILYEIVKYSRDHIAKGCCCKLVKSYSSGQPVGCNQTPMLVYAADLATRRNANNWHVRISLSDEPRIIFPVSYLSENDNINEIVDFNKGTPSVFSPNDTTAFLTNPHNYL